MKRSNRRLAQGIAGFIFVFFCGSAAATYVFNSIEYPGAQSVQTWGINNVGQIAVATENGAFIYQGGTFVPLPAPPAGLSIAAVGINDSGAVVGGAYDATGIPEVGFILTGGTYQLFLQPGWDHSEGRAIGNSGVVTGYSYTYGPTVTCPQFSCTVGFIYDPSRPTGEQFTSVAPAGSEGRTIIAQGINAGGQVVGSYGQYTALGATAFLREPDGTITTFRINGYPTAARGINDNGLIVGWAITPGAVQAAFVGNSSGFELLQCPATACPGIVETFGEGINNDGQIVGGWNDASGVTHGFIATPASLPSGTTAGGAYTFDVAVVPNQTIFIDPATSLGFDYEIGIGDPKFASVRLPIGIGDNRYTLIVHGQAFALVGGEFFDFAAHGFTKGVAQFRVVDIEASAGLDPNNAAAFPTGLTFTGAGRFTGTMTPLCRNQPMPGRAPTGRGLSPCSP